MDSSGCHNQRSLSSINLPVQVVDQQGLGSTGSSEFVNHGLTLWNQTRERWTGNRRPDCKQEVREPRFSWNATYDSLLGTNKPFAKPIPLREMIDFLVDEWEQEGFYE